MVQVATNGATNGGVFESLSLPPWAKPSQDWSEQRAAWWVINCHVLRGITRSKESEKLSLLIYWGRAVGLTKNDGTGAQNPFRFKLTWFCPPTSTMVPDVFFKTEQGDYPELTWTGHHYQHFLIFSGQEKGFTILFSQKSGSSASPLPAQPRQVRRKVSEGQEERATQRELRDAQGQTHEAAQGQPGGKALAGQNIRWFPGD